MIQNEYNDEKDNDEGNVGDYQSNSNIMSNNNYLKGIDKGNLEYDSNESNDVINNDNNDVEHIEKEDSDIIKLNNQCEGILLCKRSESILILGMSTVDLTKTLEKKKKKKGKLHLIVINQLNVSSNVLI